MTNQTNVRKAGAPQGWTLVLINQLPAMAIASLMPVLPTLFEHFANVPNKDVLVPMLITAPGICIALLAPFAGLIVDKYGRRKLLVTFVLLYGIGGILPFFIDGFGLVFTGRLLLGIGEAFVLVIMNSLLGDYFDQSGRSKWLTIQGIVGPVAGAGLLVLSGHLANMGWNYPFLVYGIAIIMAFFAWLFLFEPSTKVADTEPIAEESKGFPYKTVAIVALSTLFIATLYFVYTIHFSRVLDEMGIKDKIKLGNASAIASFGVPVGALIYRLVYKRPAWQQIALVFLLFAIGLSVIGFAKNVNTAIAGAWIQQLGAGMTIPVLIGWALHVIPVEYRGRGMGFWTSGFFLGQFVNPVYVSLVKNTTGSLGAAFVTTGIICLSIALLLIIYNIATSRKKVSLT
ncbi:MAG: MFS transporter [Flavisolibacter sp.]|nr:MFS transporter [Flavisolibacter sp.]